MLPCFRFLQATLLLHHTQLSRIAEAIVDHQQHATVFQQQHVNAEISSSISSSEARIDAQQPELKSEIIFSVQVPEMKDDNMACKEVRSSKSQDFFHSLDGSLENPHGRVSNQAPITTSEDKQSALTLDASCKQQHSDSSSPKLQAEQFSALLGWCTYSDQADSAVQLQHGSGLSLLSVSHTSRDHREDKPPGKQDEAASTRKDVAVQWKPVALEGVHEFTTRPGHTAAMQQGLSPTVADADPGQQGVEGINLRS